MSVLSGYQDLKPKTVIGQDTDGMLLVNIGDKTNVDLRKYEMVVMPNGALYAQPYEPDRTPDQVGGQPRASGADKWRGVDQVS
jgi:hypothetical protein